MSVILDFKTSELFWLKKHNRQLLVKNWCPYFIILQFTTYRWSYLLVFITGNIGLVST